jgi:hypothetical protein
MGYTELRLKILRFFRKNKYIILILLIVLFVIITINTLLRSRVVVPEPTTTLEPHVSVMNNGSSTPSRMAQTIEEYIKEYMGYVDSQDFDKAFEMITEECREKEFNNDIFKYILYVKNKKPNSNMTYNIQDYSNVTIDGTKYYIYEIHYTEDLLATGLTNSEYMFTTEKMAFFRDKDGNIKMTVGDYIGYEDVQSVAENEYLKIDIINKLIEYQEVTYEVRFTNRSEYTVVVADGYGSAEENVITLKGETRKEINGMDVVLNPGESKTFTFTYTKFVDDGDTISDMTFGSIRIMEQYSGTDLNVVTEDQINQEISNAIDKFSMKLAL